MFCGFFLKKKTKKQILYSRLFKFINPPFCDAKDFIKKYFNFKPNLRIFNSKLIKDKMKYNDNVPFIIRSQGVLKKFFQKRSKKFIYDFLYTGSIEARKGLDKIFLNI